MSCAVSQELCSIFAGDSLNYKVSLKKDDGTPIDVRRMTIYFTMKINKSDDSRAKTSLQFSMVFPDNEDSANGEGDMVIPATLTNGLLGARWYQFDFQLVAGAAVHTIGNGKIFVKQKVRS